MKSLKTFFSTAILLLSTTSLPAADKFSSACCLAQKEKAPCCPLDLTCCLSDQERAFWDDQLLHQERDEEQFLARGGRAFVLPFDEAETASLVQPIFLDLPVETLVRQKVMLWE